MSSALVYLEVGEKVMKSAQAWGWLTAGVLALGLNGFYQDGGMQWAHEALGQFVHRSAAVVALATGSADRFVAEASQISANGRRYACARSSNRDRALRVRALPAVLEEDSVLPEVARAKFELQRGEFESAMAELHAAAEVKSVDCALGKLQSLNSQLKMAVPVISVQR